VKSSRYIDPIHRMEFAEVKEDTTEMVKEYLRKGGKIRRIEKPEEVPSVPEGTT